MSDIHYAVMPIYLKAESSIRYFTLKTKSMYICYIEHANIIKNKYIIKFIFHQIVFYLKNKVDTKNKKFVCLLHFT